ncbi:4641_t:CDS:2, partial [Racocetra fulgida]
RDKGVIMAAKSLIGLFREINPEMLKRKDYDMKDFKPLQYGKIHTTEQIEGIELLEEYKKQQMQEGWEVASNASSNEDWNDLLTPTDFFKPNEFKMKHKVKQLINGGKRKSDAYVSIDVNFIAGPRKKAKQDYEERIESIKAGGKDEK